MYPDFLSAMVARSLGMIALVMSTIALQGAAGAWAETRVALVIGNGGYKSVPELANPPNDAKDVSEALKSLGFKVTLAIDVDQARMKTLVAEFGKASETAAVSLFYYGGHGLQVSAHNYLIPVDAQVKTVDDIDKRTLHFDEVLDAQSKGPGIHLVFLDACRVNPIKNAGSALQSAGLARVGNAAGFLIAFATQPDNVAYDGPGRNSPFAQSLLTHIATQGADVSSMMISVRRDVIASTGGAQIPWENSSLTKQFYFAGDAASEASPDTLLWQLAGSQRDPNLLKFYLQRYPNGNHANDVRVMLAQIGDVAAPAVKPGAAVEEDLWRLALASRERNLVDLYLARYPTGAHRRDAEALMDTLRASDSDAKDPARVCERLANVPADATASAPGVEFEDLAAHAAAAVEACQKAVEAHPDVAHYLALLARATYATGRYDEGVTLFRKAADAGDGRAMRSLGYMMEKGDHVPKDIKGAYALYEKAAAKGNSDAAVDLAVALFKGDASYAKNVTRAIELFKKASLAGSVEATFNLASLARDGKYGKPSDALDLYRQAATLGSPRGYQRAAELLDEGKIVPKDIEGAADEMLRCVAADSGECLRALTDKAQKLSVDTIKAIQGRLRTAGYYSGAVDGKAGASLAPALKQWRLLGPPQKA